MPWIAENRSLNQQEMENNASLAVQDFRSEHVHDFSIAAILVNMQGESTINPAFEEVGGEGYGLVQWTPKSDLENACNVLNLHPYTDGDVQCSVVTKEVVNTPGVEQWYSSEAFITPYYESGATSDMIGITGDQFLRNEMNWSVDKLVILFMVCYLRPSYDPNVNHYTQRMTYANSWYEWMGGTPPLPAKTRKMPIWMYTRLF